MREVANVFPQLEQAIINESKLNTVNHVVFIVLMHIRKYMFNRWHTGWSEVEAAKEDLKYILCNLDYAKIGMQAGLLSSKRPYCEECICEINDKDFTCSFTKNKADCLLLNIAKRLDGGEHGGNG